MPAPHHGHPFEHKHDKSIPDIVIEFSEVAHARFDHAHTAADWLVKSAKIYYGERAFRSYSWLKATPKLNKVGDLRGMVLNKKSRALFDLTVETGEKLDKFNKVLVVASWALELAKSKDYIANTLASSNDPATKAQKISAEISLATIRALAGSLPMATHLVAAALTRGVRTVHAPSRWEGAINATDAQVASFYRRWTNTDQVVHYINTHLVY